MRWSFGVTYAAALLGLGNAAVTAVVQDAETGFTFSEYAASYAIGSNSITFRVAVPTSVPEGEPYDVVFQIIAPVAVGWTGLAWGGSMTNCPLTIGWANGQSALVSARRASSHVAPTPDTATTIQVLTTGTKANSTHWQVTAKCTGCSSFTGSGSTAKYLNPAGGNRLAFAYSRVKPSNPSSSSATLNVHEVYNYWDHDFATAANPEFAALVEKNA
ncbi:hypothetical protein F4778DRAFT_773068 [Xylariomycetidae sp. FL2044]|nr:hypothetical protein F4778DRAFT_773068 [Xylariomycetidae sp. FL2044]